MELIFFVRVATDRYFTKNGVQGDNYPPHWSFFSDDDGDAFTVLCFFWYVSNVAFWKIHIS